MKLSEIVQKITDTYHGELEINITLYPKHHANIRVRYAERDQDARPEEIALNLFKELNLPEHRAHYRVDCEIAGFYVMVLRIIQIEMICDVDDKAGAKVRVMEMTKV